MAYTIEICCIFVPKIVQICLQSSKIRPPNSNVDKCAILLSLQGQPPTSTKKFHELESWCMACVSVKLKSKEKRGVSNKRHVSFIWDKGVSVESLKNLWGLDCPSFLLFLLAVHIKVIENSLWRWFPKEVPFLFGIKLSFEPSTTSVPHFTKWVSAISTTRSAARRLLCERLQRFLAVNGPRLGPGWSWMPGRT